MGPTWEEYDPLWKSVLWREQLQEQHNRQAAVDDDSSDGTLVHRLRGRADYLANTRAPASAGLQLELEIEVTL
jgi:hypothetical protein